ncbi:MFS transporter [Bordetella bronchialis]|uniref:MFS transporter n=1 Tax=Bordetella bronchialis TaxID=463025 RepID=A0ABM6CTJ9_9BORD|nr:MFS transporter [Bordetella bronchialis]ANN67394.1 MFS transporter [Bordetella bronchialis]
MSDRLSSPPSGAAPAPHAGPWYRDVSRDAWRVLALSGLGWLFEVYEIFILSLTVPAFIVYFDLTRAEAGLIGSLSALGQIVGGIAFGWVADRYGRVKTLIVTILIYSVFSGATALAAGAAMVAVTRVLAGLGMGGSWTAGAALVAETWRPEHRGKGGALMQLGLPLGSLLAIGIVALVSHAAGGLDGGGWRWVYAIGLLPIVILYPVARRTPESPVWLARVRTGEPRGRIADLLRPENAKGLVKAFGFIFFVQYVYWAVFTWTPTFLVTVKHFNFVHSLGFTLAQQLGSLIGFLVFATLVDRIGRKATFSLYLLIGAIAVIGFVTIEQERLLLVASFFTGLGITGLFAGMGPFAAELVPRTAARGFAMGLAYNGGRIGGMIAPYLIGALATSAAGFKTGMLTTVVAFVLAWMVVLISPETKGQHIS